MLGLGVTRTLCAKVMCRVGFMCQDYVPMGPYVPGLCAGVTCHSDLMCIHVPCWAYVPGVMCRG